jgi:hypothetical protein
MKATLDLPGDLIKEMKLRAVHGDRKFKDVVADTIRRGLAAPEPPPASVLRHRVKLPIIQAPPGAPKVSLTGEDIDHILNKQEIGWLDETARH